MMPNLLYHNSWDLTIYHLSLFDLGLAILHHLRYPQIFPTLFSALQSIHGLFALASLLLITCSMSLSPSLPHPPFILMCMVIISRVIITCLKIGTTTSIGGSVSMHFVEVLSRKVRSSQSDRRHEICA